MFRVRLSGNTIFVCFLLFSLFLGIINLLYRRRAMAQPSNSEGHTDQQVMRAQTAGPGLEGEDTAPDYAAALPALPNGVGRPEASPQSMQSIPWSPSMMGSEGGHGTTDQAVEQRPEPPRLPVESSTGSGLGVRTSMGAHSGGLGSSNATAEWPPALRWMGRLNEFPNEQPDPSKRLRRSRDSS